MQRLAIVDNDLISVWVYPDKKIVHHQMKGYCHGADFREALSKGLEALREHQATKWLSDDRLNGGQLPADDEVWATQTWFPATKAAGWLHWAVVQPAKVLAQVNVQRYITMYEELGINARMFTDADEAFTWLDAQ